MHEDLTQQEEGHVSYFTCLVARHLIKMLNVLVDDGEICAGRKKKDILKRADIFFTLRIFVKEMGVKLMGPE